MRLEGKVGIVTGSASGFGRTTAVRFAEEGAKVVVVDLDAANGAETVELVGKAGSEALLVVEDISTVTGARAAVAAAVDRFSGVDVLVNNAGISQSEPPRDTWNADEEIWDRLILVNLKSVYACCRATSRELAAQGVRVNCVSPGIMRTPMTTGERDGLTPDEQEKRIEEFGRKVPMRSCGSTTWIPSTRRGPASSVVIPHPPSSKYL